MTEAEILGFDPTSLSIFNEPEEKSSSNPLIYRTRPADSKSEDGIYRSTIKVVYNPHNFKNSIIEQQSYAMNDENGFFSVVSSLTVNDTDCPIFKAWKKCRYSEAGSTLNKQCLAKKDGGKELFDKRYARYAVVQILEDKNQPDLVGKYLFWKLPKSIWTLINSKMNPSKESNKSPIPIMDFLFGRSIDIEVKPGPDDPKNPERKTREISYEGELSEDAVSCINPDGSPLLNTEEQNVLDEYVSAMNKVWKSKDASERERLLTEINASPNKVKLQEIYKKKLEEIKSVCPNIEEHLSYKEWTPEVKVRVEKWINVVLSGNDPATASAAPEAAKTIDNDASVQTQEPLISSTVDDKDDLPF